MHLITDLLFVTVMFMMNSDEQCIDSFSKQSARQKISSSRWPVMFSCLVIKGDVGLSVYLMQKSFL